MSSGLISKSTLMSKSLFRLANITRTLVTTKGVRQEVRSESEEEWEQEPMRPAAAQMPNMTDIGSRSLFSSEQDMFRESVRKFVREVMSPQEDKFEEDGQPSREAWKAMGDQGLLGVNTPAELGGIGGTFIDEMIVTEELAYGFAGGISGTGLHSSIVMPYLTNYGTPEQQSQYIPAMTAGTIISSIGMTEPDAGSDLQGIRTSAKKDGTDWIINGSKIYITNGFISDLCVVVAKTNPDAKRAAHGVSLFLVPADTPGFHKGRKLKKLGLKSQDTAELFFEDVRVPSSALLGKENYGFYQLMNELPQERVLIAVGSMCMSEAMFEITREWVKERKVFGGRVSDLQVVQHKLAELKTSIAVCRAFVDQCLALHNEGKLGGEMASMSKYWATDLENKVAADCLQLHGGWGFMWETKIAKCYANARVQTIYGGTNEIMKELIARNIVKK